MCALIHFHCGTHLCEETPGISPDQLWAPVSHTPSLYPYSRAQQLGLGQTFELNTGIKSFSQHKTPQFTGTTLSHPPPDSLLWFLKPCPWRPLSPRGRTPLSPSSCAGETVVWAKLRLRPGYNRFNIQITYNLHHQKSLYCLFQPHSELQVAQEKGLLYFSKNTKKKQNVKKAKKKRKTCRMWSDGWNQE